MSVEVSGNGRWIRPFHRWVSMAFTLTVVANFAAMALGTPPAWLTYSPLLPLAMLLFSGLYLFVLSNRSAEHSGS